MNRTIRIRGAALMHQQCWCWGADVRRAEGNLLTSYGFHRVIAPDGERGSTRYQCSLSHGSVTLWGFGMFFSYEGADGVYLNRYKFNPKFTSDTDAVHGLFAPDYTLPMQSLGCERDWLRRRDLLADAVRWIGRYERWVAHEFGIRYRSLTLEAWPLVAVPAACMADTWDDLSQEIRQLTEWEQEEPPELPPAFAVQKT